MVHIQPVSYTHLENAILTDRVIDRPMRPLFPKDYRNDVTLKMCIRDRSQSEPEAG